VTHHAAPVFWACYHALPVSIQALADKSFVLLKTDPRHPALHLKKVGAFWSARMGRHHRALGVQILEGVLWLWIGTHAEYDTLVR
jgi:hypothetical protein